MRTLESHEVSHEVLVAREHDDGTAAVLRSGGDPALWLTGYLERGPGTGLDGFRPAIEGLTGDRTGQGGMLPPGAVAAHVVDAAGTAHLATTANDAWVIVLDQPITGELAPVHFMDADDRPVLSPLPAAWSRSPVLDADEPCPACYATEWDEVRPLDESRGLQSTGDGGMEPTPVVVCRVCGHEEQMGVYLRFGDGQAEGTLRARTLAAVQRRRERALMARVDFPVYAAAGWTPRLGGWGLGLRRGLHSVTVKHGVETFERGSRLTVETDREADRHEGERALARQALELPLSDEEQSWPDRSDAGLTVWLHARERERLELATRATVSSRPLALASTQESFEVVEVGRHWAAAPSPRSARDRDGPRRARRGRAPGSARRPGGPDASVTP